MLILKSYEQKSTINLITLLSQNSQDEIKEMYPPGNNLVYRMVRATSNCMAQQKPEEYRACLHRLFDEKLSLSERITYFLDESKALYASTEGKNASHHDERTASAYLTFKYPDKYTFYKNSFYSDYCDYMGIQAKNAGEKYVHYLELVRDLANNYIVKDEELLGLVEA